MAEMENLAERAECVAMCLDDLGVPEADGDESLSLWGRVYLYASENAKDRAELQERRKASAYPIPFGEFDKIRFALIDRITEGMSVDDCHSAIDDVLGECEWRYSHEPGVLCQCYECRAKREGNKS